jgi:hypothetical protein
MVVALGHQFPGFKYGDIVGVYDLRVYVGHALEDSQVVFSEGIRIRCAKIRSCMQKSLEHWIMPPSATAAADIGPRLRGDSRARDDPCTAMRAGDLECHAGSCLLTSQARLSMTATGLILGHSECLSLSTWACFMFTTSSM